MPPGTVFLPSRKDIWNLLGGKRGWELFVFYVKQGKVQGLKGNVAVWPLEYSWALFNVPKHGTMGTLTSKQKLIIFD